MATDLLTTKEACDFLRCGRTTLWNWRRKGVVPDPIRIGGAVRWKRTDLETLIDADAQREAA